MGRRSCAWVDGAPAIEGGENPNHELGCCPIYTRDLFQTQIKDGYVVELFFSTRQFILE